MTRKPRLALAAALLAGSSLLSTSAHAGGGVRLGFGFPLGTFVASPKPGGYNGPSHGYAQKRHVQKPAPRVVKHHPKYEEPKPRAAKHTPKVETAAAPRVVKRRNTEAEVARLEAPRPKRSVEQTAKPAVTESTAATEVAAPVTGTTALMEFSGTQSTPATERAAEVATNTAAEPATPPAVTEPAESKPVSSEPATSEPAETVAAAAEATTGDCKKFIPILGITISVGCGD